MTDYKLERITYPFIKLCINKQDIKEKINTTVRITFNCGIPKDIDNKIFLIETEIYIGDEDSKSFQCHIKQNAMFSSQTKIDKDCVNSYVDSNKEFLYQLIKEKTLNLICKEFMKESFLPESLSSLNAS